MRQMNAYDFFREDETVTERLNGNRTSTGRVCLFSVSVQPYVGVRVYMFLIVCISGCIYK